MKYSIRGNTFISDGLDIVIAINKYYIWRLISSSHKDMITNEEVFTFEVWLNNKENKDELFEELKFFIDNYGGYIDWHECTHDEEIQKPCVIIEEYRG